MTLPKIQTSILEKNIITIQQWDQACHHIFLKRTSIYHICRGPALVRFEAVIALNWGLAEAESAIVVTGDGCRSWSR